MFNLALKSLANRKTTVLLAVFSITLCVTLLLGVERLRFGLKESFAHTVSGVDLIVGPRAGSVNLLLYAVFHIGAPINAIDYQSFRRWSARDEVAWTIPVSLGDSHKGFRVVGTNNDFFSHYQYGRGSRLVFASGESFNASFDVVLGSQAARRLGYRLGDPVVVAHGTGAALSRHDNLPFAVTGILAPTGTPLDRSLFVPLQGITAIHVGWETGRQVKKITKEQVSRIDLTPKTITAFFIGLKRKSAIFGLQHLINNDKAEPLSAVLPGVALGELWNLMAVAENSLALVALFVVFIALVSMLITQMTALRLRQREMALLRSFGGRPRHLFQLLLLESFLIAGAGCLAGFLLLYPGQYLASTWLSQNGIYLALSLPTWAELKLLACAWAAGLVIGLIPAFTAYRKTLHENLIVKI